MTGDTDDYENDLGRMKAELAGIDFDQLTAKQIEAHDRKARKASSKGKRARPKTNDERPRLKIEKQSPEKTVADLRVILGAAGGLYDRGRIVKMVDDQTRGGSVAHVMTPAALMMATHEASRPYLVKGKDDCIEEVDAALPHQIAVMYQDWRDWGLPPLNGIAAAPLLGEDGSIRTARGYDPGTGMWCEESMPDVAGLVPRKPDKDAAAKALLAIRNQFRTFCFADAVMMSQGGGVMAVDTSEPPGMDESSFLASLLTAPCRPSLWLAPGALFGASPMSGAGVGKGLLVRCICEIAFGRQPYAITAGGTREEQEKRIAAALIAAGPALFLDNFNGVTLKSAALASALTERPAQVREFGKLDFVTLNALAFVALTGNGLVLAEDLVRRFLSIAFDARMEDPEQRRFEVSILDEVKLRRTELLVRLLTIWRYGRLGLGIEQGRPLGSYDQWCSWVRDPLVALGCCDPVARVSEAKLRDPTRQAIVTLFDLWWEQHHDCPIKANDLHDDVRHAADPQGRGRQYLAAYLERLAGTRLGGFVLTRQAPPGRWGAATYKLERADPYAPYDPYAFGHQQQEKNRVEGEIDTRGDLSRKDFPAPNKTIGGIGGIGDPSSERPQDDDDAFAPCLPHSPATKRHTDTSGRKQGESEDLSPSQSPAGVSETSVDRAHNSGGCNGLTLQNLGSRHAHREGSASLPEEPPKSRKPVTFEVVDGGLTRTIL